MLSDSPHSYKVASNLVRFLPTSSDLEEEEEDGGRHRRLPHPSIGGKSKKVDNSIGSQLEKRRHGRKRGDNRLSFENGDRKNRRRHQRRLRERKRKCDTESNSCEESTGAIDFAPSNADFVRSLDRRSSMRNRKKRRRNRRRKNNKNRKNLTEEEKRQRRERKQKRKAEEEERKLKRKERKRKLRQKRRRERRRIKQLEKEQKQQHHLNVRSVADIESSSSCQIHLVDTCSWPHCNPTCPKLSNPETGQEIDFLTLLRSFGLDLNKLAKALGVNVATLNGMERQDLLHLLSTSKQHHDDD